jgi:hypothetical protein
MAFLAPQAGLFSNQFWDELRAYATLNYLFNSVLCNSIITLEVVFIMMILI